MNDKTWKNEKKKIAEAELTLIYILPYTSHSRNLRFDSHLHVFNTMCSFKHLNYVSQHNSLPLLSKLDTKTNFLNQWKFFST